VQTEGKSLRGRGRKGNLPRLNTKIFGETGSRIIKDRSRSSRLSVPAIWIANAGAIEIGNQIHDHWERRRSRRVIQEESGWRHRSKATGTPASRHGGPHHDVGRSR
jgi:hypothetical protein